MVNNNAILSVKSNKRLISAFNAVIFSMPLFPFLIMVGVGTLNTSVIAALPVLMIYLLFFSILFKFIVDKELRFGEIVGLDVFVFLYYVHCILQSLNVNLPNLNYSLRGFHEHPHWILGYFISRYLLYPRMQKFDIMGSVIGASSLCALYGIISISFGVENVMPEYVNYIAREDNMLIYRAVGTLGSPFAFALLSAVGLFGVLIYDKYRPFSMQLYYSLFAILISGVVAANSRIVIISCIVAFLIYFFIYTPKNTKQNIIGRIFLYSITFVLFALLLYIFEEVYWVQRIFSILSFQTEAGFQARVEMWEMLWPYFLKNPFGYGTGSLGSAVYQYGSVIDAPAIADNNYIEILIEQGIAGLGLFILIIVCEVRYCYRLFRQNVSGISDWALVITIVFLISALAAPPLKAFPSNLYFWIILGSLASEYSAKKITRRFNTHLH